jgi:hypothetical protein
MNRNFKQIGVDTQESQENYNPEFELIDLKFMSDKADEEGKEMEDEIYNHLKKTKEETEQEMIYVNQSKMVLYNGG